MASAVGRAAVEQQTTSASRILCGLAVSGFLLALPGALLPLWGFHIAGDYGTAGDFFLSLGCGVIAGSVIAQRIALRAPLSRLLAGAYFSAALALLMLAVAPPPAQTWYQALALFGTGLAAGVMNTAVLEAVTPWYEANPAGATLTGGIFFGAGSAVAAFLLARSFGENEATRLLASLAVVPAIGGILSASVRIESRPVVEVTLSRSFSDLRTPLALMFALLLFFQFANEWSIAGWLPILLIDRMGLSPAAGVGLLGLYWAALLTGRIIAARLLRVVRHGRMLGVSAFFALFGCASLLASGSRFGVVTGLLLMGAGFSAIYPLSAESIGSRFSYYHPGYFNGIFTFALTGGILAPFVLGHLAAAAGLNIIPLASMAGSCAVFTLVLLIWLGRKVSGT